MPSPLAMLGLTLATVLAPTTIGAQSLQYRSPAGAEHRSQPTTETITAARAAVDAAPDNVDLIVALGLVEAGAQQYREAIATWTRGIGLAPDRAMLYRWRGHRYLSIREFELARADLERGAALDPTCYGCYYHLGIVRYIGGEWEAAADAFQRGLPLAPDPGEFAGSVDWLWSALSRGGREPQAQAVLDRHASQVTAGNAYARRIQMYRRIIGPEDVIGTADTAGTELATRSYAVGNWYLLQGDTAQARAWFERSVASGAWAAFGFIASETELRRLGSPVRPSLK